MVNTCEDNVAAAMIEESSSLQSDSDESKEKLLAKQSSWIWQGHIYRERKMFSFVFKKMTSHLKTGVM